MRKDVYSDLEMPMAMREKTRREKEEDNNIDRRDERDGQRDERDAPSDVAAPSNERENSHSGNLFRSNDDLFKKLPVYNDLNFSTNPMAADDSSND